MNIVCFFCEKNTLGEYIKSDHCDKRRKNLDNIFDSIDKERGYFVKKQAFLKKILVVLLIVMSFNINTFAQELSNGRDIKVVIGKDEKGNDYNMLVGGDLKFVDDEGNIVDPITKDARVSITFDFNVDADHLDMLQNGDYFEFDLPELMKVSMPMSGSLSDELGYTFGTYHIGVDGKVRFEFTDIEDVDLANLTGFLKLYVSLDADALENAGEKKITLPVKDGKDYEFVIEPTNPITGISKTGKVDKVLNPEYITWEVLINRDFQDLSDVVVSDELPIGLTLEDIEVLPYIMDLDGKFVGYGEPIDPDSDFYTVEKSDVLFSNIKTPFAIRYKTRINDEFKPDEGGVKEFVNEVTLNANGHEQKSTTAKVSAKYGVLLNKKDNPRYNGNDNTIPGRPGAQTFTWSIEYNYGDKTIQSPTLIDEFDADLEYVPGSMVLKYKDGTVVPPADYDVVNTGNKLEIKFKNEVNRAIDISYKTAVKEGVLVTDKTKFNNTVTTGGKESSSSGEASPQLIKKTTPSINYDEKSIAWSIDINTNRYELKEYNLVDNYINANKGLTFKEGSLRVVDVDTNATLVLDRDYEFAKTYVDGVETGYELKFIGDYVTTSNMLRVSFETYYDTRVLGPQENFVNKATLKWTDKDNVEREHSSTASRKPSDVARNNGQKFGNYDHVSKEITWTSDFNYNGNVLKNSKVVDKMLNGQKYIDGSLEIRPYTVNAVGAITRGEVLDLEGFNITYPSKLNEETLTIDLPDGDIKYSITYKTSVEGNLILDKYDNTLDFFNDGDIKRSYSNSVRPPKGGKVVDKRGNQNGAVVNWTIEINGSQSTIENAVLQDTPSDNQFYLEETFKLFPVNYKGHSYDVLRDTPLVEGVDYDLIFNKDDEGLLSFEIKFLNKLDRMYVLEYDTQISASKDNPVLSNRVELTGENYQYESLGDEASVDINVDSAGGGAVGIRGSLALRKLGKDGILLEDVVFELYKDGRKIATGTTDANGLVYFGRLIHGDYVIKEVSTQDGYVIPDDLFKGKTFQVNDQTSSDDYYVDIQNEKSKLTINKLGTDGELLAGSRFNLLMEKEGVYEVIREVVLGTVTLEGIEAGKYRLVELGTAADYILNTEPLDFEVELDGNGQVISKTVEFTNYKGSVKLIKSDENGLLAGATFDLYHNGLKLKEGLVTDVNGEITFDNELAPGNYYFIETASAGGNIINQEKLHFVISDKTAGVPETMLVTATNYKGSVTFNKVDGLGNALTGAVFDLWNTDTNTLVSTVTSDDNGKVTVNQLPVGKYEFREIKAPDGFVVNDNKIEFTINGSSANGKLDLVLEVFVNYKGSVRLNKFDEDKNLLDGVVFNLYNDGGELVYEDLTTEFGKIEVSDLAPGKYYFIETSTVGGNIRFTEPIEFEVPVNNDGSVNIIIDVLNTKASVTFKKVDVNGEPLSGIIFELVNTDTGDVVARPISDENGIVFVDGLVPGNYEFIEVTADGYIINTTELSFNVPVESDLEKIEIELDDFYNYKGSVFLAKTDELGALEGAMFDLYKKDGTLVYADLITDEDGLISLMDVLAPGEYYFIETASAGGNIINDTPIGFTIASSWKGTPEVVEVIATNAKGRVSFYKVDEYGKPIANVLFELIDLSINEVIATAVSDEFGLVSVDHLTPGRYAFREVVAADGFILNTAIVEFEILESASYDDKYELVLDDFINYKGGLVVKKVDSKGKLLSGAKFELKDSKGNIITSFTSENGTSVIGGLIPGSYTLTEVSAPKGYKLSSKSYEIVIPESYEGEYVSQEVEVINVLQDPALPNTGFSSFLMNSAFGAVLLGLLLILVSKKKYE